MTAGTRGGGDAPTPTLPACLLERLIARSAAAWTVDDLVSLAEERGIRLVTLLHVGSDGWLKTLDFVPRTARTCATSSPAASAPTARACFPASASAPALPTSCCGRA